MARGWAASINAFRTERFEQSRRSSPVPEAKLAAVGQFEILHAIKLRDPRSGLEAFAR